MWKLCKCKCITTWYLSLQWRHNERDSVSNHQPHDCLLNRIFRRRSKKTSKLHVTGLCVGNSPGTSEFPAQMASNAENVSIWWRHHGGNISSCKVLIMIPFWLKHRKKLLHGDSPGIGLDNSLVPNRRQTIFWINDSLTHICVTRPQWVNIETDRLSTSWPILNIVFLISAMRYVCYMTWLI